WVVQQRGDHEIRSQVLKERDNELGGILAADLHENQDKRDRNAGEKLQHQFAAPGESEVAAMHDLQVVVGEADAGESQRGQNCYQDEFVAQIGPKHSRNYDSDGNQHSTHSGRARFFMMALGPFLANVLANLKFTQLANDRRPNDQRHKHCCQTGECGAEGKKTKKPKRGKIRIQLLVQQPVEQTSSLAKIYSSHPAAT